MKKVFIDTNILLDVLAKRAPFYAASAKVWTLAENGKVTGMISTLSFNNIYYIMRRQSGGGGAKMAIRLLHGIFTTVPPDNQILNQALDSEMADFEDALQFFSALHAGAQCIVTRNPDDFPTGHIPILTPEEFLATSKNGGRF